MLGKTHMAVGVAAAIAVMQPQTLPILVTGMGAAAVGAVISDIDIDTSETHKEATRIMILALFSVAVVAVVDNIFRLEIIQRMLQNSSIVRIIIGCLVFFICCAVGRNTPHRSFMHSILSMAILTVAVWLIFPLAAPYFSIAFLSHLTIDILNHKRVKLLYPLKRGYCLGLCHAKGLVNSALFLSASCIVAAEIILLLLRMIR